MGDEEMDMDEDLLYMRLRALQSMKEKLDQDENDEMVDEMKELLHEADQAAQDVVSPPSTLQSPTPSPPAVTISDQVESNLDVILKSTLSNDDVNEENLETMTMSSLVKRLKEAAKKTSQFASENNHD